LFPFWLYILTFEPHIVIKDIEMVHFN
ncbi:hypothetical protein, partial [Plasmodium yoelii yoelii]